MKSRLLSNKIFNITVMTQTNIIKINTMKCQKEELFVPLTIGVLILCLYFNTFTPLNALDTNRQLSHYQIEVYTTGNGLPQSSILAMVQTRDGFLWLGTYEGIACFDGIHFRLFDTLNTPEMNSNRIRAMIEDREGTLWIGTSAGLLRYKNGKFKNFSTRDGLSDNFVRCIFEDRYGSLWIGTTQGLNRLEPENESIITFSSEHGLTKTYVSALAEDLEANLWIGTLGGGLHLYTRNSRHIRHISFQGLPANAHIQSLFRDRNGRIWIGTNDHGIAVMEKNKLTWYTREDGLSGNDIRAIFQDTHGTFWIGTNGSGLNILRNGEFSSFASNPGLLDRPCRCIIEDREGNIWIGSRDGLTQLKNGKFIIFNKQNGLPEDSIRSVFQDRAGDTWIGTVTAGLVQYKFGHFTTYGLDHGLKSLHIWSIAQGYDDSIWFGTYGGGLHHLQDGKITSVFSTANGLSDNTIRAICIDPQNRIWVGTNGAGLDMITPGNGKTKNQVQNFNHSKNGLSDDFIYALSLDQKGDLWIGTYFGNLNRFNRGQFTVYTKKDGLPGPAIWSIYPDPGTENTLWLGTDGGGLVHFKDGKFTIFTTKDGLYSDLAFQVVGDLEGNLWLNCNRGIFSVKKKDLEAFSLGKIQRIPVTSFGKTDGIKNTECNGPAQPAGVCNQDGSLLFPTSHGAVLIAPNQIKKNTTPPPVIIEKMIVDTQPTYLYPLNKGQWITLKPGKKRIEFEFTGLGFTAPDQIHFRYKLEGFDENWNDTITFRHAAYTNIPPGDYTFRVIAANEDHTWNMDGDRLTFTLSPAFWQTWWFQGLVIIGFAFLSYFSIHFVQKHMRLISFWEKRKYIGSYEIDEKIGVGGMGEIYRVHSLMDKSKSFAIKIMKEEFLLDELQKKRFKNESLLIDRIEHPHIVKVFERGEYNEKLYLVMELLQGQNLSQRYKNNNYPSITQSIHIMKQVADVLVNLHQDNIIHRDLKPENIMLINYKGDPDFVKLLDFGIARVQSFSSLTESGQVLGTLPYMPPEVLSEGNLSPAVDIYSLGIMAYEMLTRQKPFKDNKPLETIKSILHTTPPPPSALNPHIPLWLNNLVILMMDKIESNRPVALQVLAILNNPPVDN